MTRSRHLRAPRRCWTDDELELLCALYPDTPTKDLAQQLRRDIGSVYQKAIGMGLRKTPEYLASPAASRLRRGDKVGAAYRFEKGHTSWNKGTHYTAGGRSAETRFKKGHFPANKDPEYYVLGALRVNDDGYIDMRVSFEQGAKGWRALHRILWEDAHGPVPDGFALCFRDRDKLNVELDNIELVSRAELCRRNSIHNLPQPLKSAIQALGQFKRRIREREDRRPAASPVRDAAGSA